MTKRSFLTTRPPGSPSEYAYNDYDVPADLLHRMHEVVSEIGRKVRLIGDLGSSSARKIERKTELLTDQQDMLTEEALPGATAMVGNSPLPGVIFQ